jgi:hypothetical protein
VHLLAIRLLYMATTPLAPKAHHKTPRRTLSWPHHFLALSPSPNHTVNPHSPSIITISLLDYDILIEEAYWNQT